MIEPWSGGLKYGGGDGQEDPGHRGHHVGYPVGGGYVIADGSNRQHSQADRGGHTDRAHARPTNTPTTPASSSSPIIRHCADVTPRWSRITSDCRTPSSLMEPENVKSTASKSVTITAAIISTG